MIRTIKLVILASGISPPLNREIAMLGWFRISHPFYKTKDPGIFTYSASYLLDRLVVH